MLKKVKSGFSLVELSLVLIIVALIISAVVSGKSLVQNSKLTLLHSEMQTLKIALGNYINDNQKSSFIAGTDINLYDLMNEGYLEDKTVTKFGGSEIKSSATSGIKNNKSNIFKSKYSGGVWKYAGDANDVIVKFGKLKKTNDGSVTEVMEQLLTTNQATIFKNKYEKAGAIKIENENPQTDNPTADSGLQITFLDGAQN